MPALTPAACLCARFMKRVATRRLRRLREVKLRLAAVLAIAVHLRGTHGFSVCSYRGAAASAAAGATAAGDRVHPAAAGSIAGGDRCPSYLAKDARWRSATRAGR